MMDMSIQGERAGSVYADVWAVAIYSENKLRVSVHDAEADAWRAVARYFIGSNGRPEATRFFENGDYAGFQSWLSEFLSGMNSFDSFSVKGRRIKIASLEGIENDSQAVGMLATVA